MKSVCNIVSVACSQLKASLCIRLHSATYKNQAQSELCTERWRTAWCFSITVSLSSRHFLCSHSAFKKKSSVAQKDYWISTKQTVSQVMLHKKLNKTQKKCCVTIKKVMLHKKRDSCRFKIFCIAQERNTCRKKQLLLVKKVLCCTKKSLSLHKIKVSV